MAGKHPRLEIGLIYTDQDYGTTCSSKTYRAKNEDKKRGSYERFAAKEKNVSCEPFVDRSGRQGYKDEHLESTTYKFGDKDGYTEVSCEKKVKHVEYNKSSSSNYNSNKAKRSYQNGDKYYSYDNSSSNNYKRVKWSYKECDD